MSGEQESAATLEAVRLAALTMARRQSAPIAAQADDIAMSVVEKFLVACRERVIDDPVAWARSTAYWMSTDLAKNQKAQRDHEESTDTEDAVDPIDVDPYGYPFRRAAGADAVAFALACLSDRERQLVELVDAGYSHAEIATMMGYSSARSVTTTLNRIRDKVDDHIGGEDERILLLEPVYGAMESPLTLLEEDDDEHSGASEQDQSAQHPDAKEPLPTIGESDPERFFRGTL